MTQISASSAAIKLRTVGYIVKVEPDYLKCSDETLYFALEITDGMVSKDRFSFYYRLGAIFN